MWTIRAHRGPEKCRHEQTREEGGLAAIRGGPFEAITEESFPRPQGKKKATESSLLIGPGEQKMSLRVWERK